MTDYKFDSINYAIHVTNWLGLNGVCSILNSQLFLQQLKMKQSTYLKKVGPYCLIKEIGSGSFARVFKGRLEGKNEEVAIKMIWKQNVRSESMTAIQKEMEILRKFNHPNIIRLLDCKETQNHYYLVFEYCANGDLDAYIRKYTSNGRLPEPEVRRIVQQLAFALAEMHKLRIVHRDLKLANILVSTNFQIKLADFGFAKFMEEENYLTSYCGTPLTMAPEILRREKYNEKCDVWSVGVIIYQMVFGKAPFVPPKGGNIYDLLLVIEQGKLQFPQIEVSRQLKDMLASMLQKDFKKRMSFLEFFQHEWLKGRVEDEYIKSIKPETHDSSIETTMTSHKISEDILIDETQQVEREEPPNTDQQLKYIGAQLLKQSTQYLDQVFSEATRVKRLADRLASQKLSYPFLQSKVSSLCVAIRFYHLLLLQQIKEFMKEQVVVLNTKNSNSSLITLQMKKPFERHASLLQRELAELMQVLKEQKVIVLQLEQGALSIGHTIYDETIELLQNLYEHKQRIERSVLEEVLGLLGHFVENPPSLMQVELQINLESFSDMNYYWHLFKLVRMHHEYIAECIENSLGPEQSEGDQKLQFKWLAQREDADDVSVNFTKDEIKQLQQLVNEQLYAPQ